jgi:DNA repair protein RadC
MLKGAKQELEEPSPAELTADILLLSRLLSLGGERLSSIVETAEMLVHSMGSAPAVIDASPFLLQKKGLTLAQVAAVRTVRDAMEVCLRRRMERRPLINSHEKAIDYLHRRLAYECREKLAVIFLTKRLRFLHYEEISFGSLSATPYCTRTIAMRALEVNAGAIIVAHNHPSGNPDPTSEDRQMGYVLQRLCADLGIDLLDNIVIASTGSRSIVQESHNEYALSKLKRDTAIDIADEGISL